MISFVYLQRLIVIFPSGSASKCIFFKIIFHGLASDYLMTTYSIVCSQNVCTMLFFVVGVKVTTSCQKK